MIEPTFIELSVTLLGPQSRPSVVEGAFHALQPARPAKDGAKGGATDGPGVGARAVRGYHVRAARALLDWPMSVLAQSSRVSVSTVKRLEENAEHDQSLRSREKVVATLRRAGIRFVTLDDGTLAIARAPTAGAEAPSAPPA